MYDTCNINIWYENCHQENRKVSSSLSYMIYQCMCRVILVSVVPLLCESLSCNRAYITETVCLCVNRSSRNIIIIEIYPVKATLRPISQKSPLKSAPLANPYKVATNSGYYCFVFWTRKQNLKVLQTIVTDLRYIIKLGWPLYPLLSTNHSPMANQTSEMSFRHVR